MKSTRTALLLSFCSIVLCVVMLVGTTFAWFTDTASAAVSMVQSGTLDIVLEYATDWDSSGNPTVWADTANLQGSLQFRKAAEAGSEPVRWEPGCTYSLPELRIRNNGSLALKYKVKITGIDGDDAFSKSINWNIRNSADGNNPTSLDEKEYHLTAKTSETAPAHILTISGTMLDNAGKDCQGKKLNGIRIAIVATQDTVEYDSNGQIYDQTAEYPEFPDEKNVVKVSSLAELKAALKTAAEDGSTVLKLTNNISGQITVSAGKVVTIDLNGYEITSKEYKTIIVDGDLTVKDTSTAKNGKITNTFTNKPPYTVYLNSAKATFTLLSGTIQSGTGKDEISTSAINNASGKACTINIIGGTVTVPDGHTKSCAAKAGKGAVVNISGGLLHGGTYGLDCYDGAVATVTGGEINAVTPDGRNDEYGKQYGVHLKGLATLTIGALDVESTPVVQGVKFEANGSVETTLPTISLIKGDITSPIYCIEPKYSYSLFKLVIAADAPVTFADNTANFFLPEGLQMVENSDGTWKVTPNNQNTP